MSNAEMPDTGGGRLRARAFVAVTVLALQATLDLVAAVADPRRARPCRDCRHPLARVRSGRHPSSPPEL